MKENETLETGKVKIIQHNTYEQATSAAYSEAANTGGFTFPVVSFKQGNRLFLSGAFPIGFVQTRLYSRSAEKGKGASSTILSMNRPLDPKHTKSVSKYLSENIHNKYIIPPLTLNVQEDVMLHTISTAQTFKAGYLVIPAGVNLSITDGQHRVQAIKDVIGQLPSNTSLLSDSIAVMITCEYEFRQIHQDFADCSKTKPLPPSLLSVYDSRNPANRLVFDIENNCPLLKGRLDTSSKTLSKKSSFLFLANQIRQMLKHLITRGNPTDVEFEKRVNERLGKEQQYENYSTTYIEFINTLTEAIPVWKHIAQLDIHSPEKGQVEKLREDGWVCLTATGLNVLGCVGYDLFTYRIEDWKSYVSRLSDVDWSRQGPVWEGSIVQQNRLLTQSGPIRTAAEKLEKAIGLFETINVEKNFRRQSM